MVTYKTVLLYPAINRNNITAFYYAVVGYTMHHLLVHRNAKRGRKTVVPFKHRYTTTVAYKFFGNFIKMLQGKAFFYFCRHQAKGFRDQQGRVTHQFNF